MPSGASASQASARPRRGCDCRATGRQRHEQHDAGAARGRGRGGERTRPRPVAGAGGVEGADGDEQEQALRVGRAEVERGREQRQQPDGRAGDRRPSSSSTRRSSSHSAPAKHASETPYADDQQRGLGGVRQDERADEQRVQREERGVGAAVVAVMRRCRGTRPSPSARAERRGGRRTPPSGCVSDGVVEVRRVRAARRRPDAATRTAQRRRPTGVTSRNAAVA